MIGCSTWGVLLQFIVTKVIEERGKKWLRLDSEKVKARALPVHAAKAQAQQVHAAKAQAQQVHAAKVRALPVHAAKVRALPVPQAANRWSDPARN